MFGEIYNNDDDVHAPESGHMLLVTLANTYNLGSSIFNIFFVPLMCQATLCFISFFHVFLQALGIIKHDASRAAAFEEAGLKCRFPYFKSWRQYEHVHTLFWCGKDFSWNIREPYTWVSNVTLDVLGDLNS